MLAKVAKLCLSCCEPQTPVGEQIALRLELWVRLR